MNRFAIIAIITITICMGINFLGQHYKLAGNFGSEGKTPIRLVVK